MTVKSDETGIFTLTGVMPGQYQLWAATPDGGKRQTQRVDALEGIGDCNVTFN
jgi:hypothetical protein